ncbi:transposase-like protein [Paraburkholderia sp. 35.1]
MKNEKSLYHGHRFPAAVISSAVRWYFKFQLSLRDIEELLFERGLSSATKQPDAGAINSVPVSPTVSKRRVASPARHGTLTKYL